MDCLIIGIRSLANEHNIKRLRGKEDNRGQLNRLCCQLQAKIPKY